MTFRYTIRQDGVPVAGFTALIDLKSLRLPRVTVFDRDSKIWDDDKEAFSMHQNPSLAVEIMAHRIVERN